MSAPRSRDDRWWDQRRFGLLVHTSAAAVPAWAPIGQYSDWYRAHIDGSVPDVLLHPSPMVETLAHHQARWGHLDHFTDFEELLTFDEFDASDWAQLAVDAGMTYTLMVAKHHDGLCWWDAPNTDHAVTRVGPRRDVLGEYAVAARSAGLVFGTYYSLLDWNAPSYPSCSYVDDLLHPHLLDLVDRYGSMMLWGDGHWGRGGTHWRSDDLITAARRIQPALVVNDRWWAEAPTVRSFEYRLPPAVFDRPWEARRGLGGGFAFNRAETDDHLLAPAAIVALLTEVVAKGGHLLLSVGPDAHGRIPPEHASRLRAAGAWVRRHRALVDRSRPWREWGDERCRYLVLGDDLHVVDVAGQGRFDALARRTGRVLRLVRVGLDDGERPVEFEQTDRGLQVLPRGRAYGASHAPGHGGSVDQLPAVYRVELEPPPPAPAELFPPPANEPIPLADLVRDAAAGSVVQLGDGTYVGPVRVPDGVVLRGLGPARTVIEGVEGAAIAVGERGRIEHCTIRGGGERIAWLPKPAVRLAGRQAALLGCVVDGHVEVHADECRATSCTVTGVVAKGYDRVEVHRCTSRGMNWDCAIDIEGGTGHLVEGCDIDQVLQGVRLVGTVGAVVRGNRVSARWWGVHAVDTEATSVAANSFVRITRAVDVDGGALAEVTGNAVADGDSGCLVQRGASDVTVAGNRWERTRVGLIVWDAGPVRSHDNDAVDLLEPDSATLHGP
jgi:alpha-L-fucosidase